MAKLNFAITAGILLRSLANFMVNERPHAFIIYAICQQGRADRSVKISYRKKTISNVSFSCISPVMFDNVTTKIMINKKTDA